MKKAQSSQHNAQTRQSLRSSQTLWQSVDVLVARDSRPKFRNNLLLITILEVNAHYAINNYILC